jgi:hypothetical protein
MSITVLGADNIGNSVEMIISSYIGIKRRAIVNLKNISPVFDGCDYIISTLAPSFLQPLVYPILSAGKSLNVLLLERDAGSRLLDLLHKTPILVTKFQEFRVTTRTFEDQGRKAPVLRKNKFRSTPDCTKESISTQRFSPPVVHRSPTPPADLSIEFNVFNKSNFMDPKEMEKATCKSLAESLFSPSNLGQNENQSVPSDFESESRKDISLPVCALSELLSDWKMGGKKRPTQDIYSTRICDDGDMSFCICWFLKI